MENEKLLEKLVEAITDRKKWSKEQRRQESLKRASEEIEHLRKKLKMAQLDPAENLDKPPEENYENNSEKMIEKDTDSDLEVLVTNCEVQCHNLQGMFDGLIKLIGEVGPLDGNNRCLNQLCDFVRDFQGQEQIGRASCRERV